ncbi:uncharacterized protein LOC143277011 [Babylonia areolata]|uniref:uncharacterized protein LOC143277011 n=1 Tax=Babylonia areolata TaxID=304850 RepID=UPI003FD24C3F
MWNSSLQLLMNVTGTNAISSSINNFDNVSEQELTVAPALFPFRNECIQVRFGDMEFIPWDNPDNILSREAETWFHRVQDNLIVVLFLIGGPANIINMLVFYKQGLSDRVNLLLFSLSFSDGMTLLTFMFVHAEQIHIQFTTQEKYGPIERFIWSSNVIGFAAFGYVSIVQVAIIATERCLCVYSPLKFQHLLKTRTMAIIIAMVYVSVLGLFFLVVFRYRIDCLYDQTNGMLITTFVEGEFYRDHKKLVDYVDSVTYGVGLPGTVLVVVLTMTILTIVKLRGRLHGGATPPPQAVSPPRRWPSPRCWWATPFSSSSASLPTPSTTSVGGL